MQKHKQQPRASFQTIFFTCDYDLSYTLSPLASSNYLLQSICLKLMYQFLFLINGYLFFRCLEKVFEEERNGNRKWKSRDISKTWWPKEDRKEKDRNDEISGFDLVFVGWINTDVTSAFAVIGCFFILLVVVVMSLNM